MKIAITGHSAGIGQALAEAYVGNDIVGLSRRNGFNIRSVPKVADAIEPCDMFVSNAQAGYAQTELLFEMVKRWKGTNKEIVVISTMMTQHPISHMEELAEYRVQKIALEEAVRQLRSIEGPKITLVRPGYIATQPGQTTPPAADPNNWARVLVATMNMARANKLDISDISLGPLYDS
jgi:NAD(P)-dependent dehydrogenase (short-subunit alcohol dehydrogenase family)